MLNMQTVWKPKDLAEAWELRNTVSDSTFVSGATWLRAQWEENPVATPRHIIRLDHIPELKGVHLIEEGGGQKLIIGAMTTLSECMGDSLLHEWCPSVVTSCGQIAAPSVRNQGTIGGNVMTGTGDTLPALLTYDAQLCWYQRGRMEWETLETWLNRCQTTPLTEEQRILVRVGLPLAPQNEPKGFSFFTKVGRRETFIPSLVSVAGKGRLDRNGIVKYASLAVGGSAACPMRLSQAEALLEHQPISRRVMESLYSTIIQEFDVGDDPFATKVYKKKVAANLIVSQWFSAQDRLAKGGVIREAHSS
ncbi:xanthine dehydrogenase subunit C [Halalkalibacterium halodurans]|uniref:BH0747 protein n=1 Tax=Halalkalibacterium halodurans (strain ATCC BAA-125 / DSM 18197 / FERM 7344 / JCM 9153 / C-125) TaxID=272558 RepID=Q9KEV2_HALH5|nr:xanthine dehydrogenase subunit C [Halalkalibacterium halodurans]MDY7221252.1 xanthine dehydrogenase subunit C [Halalkalibacterium halodurans]MDY7240491.1 xanthine dehydrogenase subunit C [Halalkalibacterium halodurans]MED4080373.1 xanthine dehydrogenase subunit C [Halalkalibacterium halodurans]MED4084563.1 xanthine dehydrogenase subunit C [Halalkalibacterium halodurans]MED4104873.1 xanthine dehydrogenase subunit C [Halalkalibacterium halodurans]